METFIAVDRNVAEAVFGTLPGRPTISRRVGGTIGRTLGISTEAATGLFHAALLVGGFVWLARMSKK